MLYNHPQTNSSAISHSPQAMLHLLLHCCSVDGECNESEVRTVYAIMSRLYKVNEEWLNENSVLYQRYLTRTSHHPSYLHYLLRQINTNDPEALLWYCAQVTVADGVVSFAEELLFERMAAILHVGSDAVKALLRTAWHHRTKSSGAQSIDVNGWL